MSIARSWAVALAAATAIAAAACGGAGEEPGRGQDSRAASSPTGFEGPYTDVEVYPVFVSSELVVGRNRFLMGLLDRDDAPVGSPDVDVEIAFYELDVSSTEPFARTDTRFVWAIEPVRGLYVANVTFQRPGRYGAEVNVSGDGLDATVRGSFDVQRTGSTPAIGERPPASETPTADSVDRLSEISTDEHPDERFYRLSIDDALASGRPTVVVFATPKYCTSEVCGPTLDIVKQVAKGFSDVNFIHVEVYENLDDPSNLEPVPAVEDWGLPSEPWVFVMDSRGKVAAKYEGVVGAGELRAELRTL